MSEGTGTVPSSPALRDDDVVPARGLSHRRSHISGSETPVERFAYL